MNRSSPISLCDWPGFDEQNPAHQLLHAFLRLDIQCAPSQLNTLREAMTCQQGSCSGNAYHYECNKQGICIEPLYDEDEQLPTIIPYPLAQSALNFWQQQCD
ncbi:hypothetical protein MNBD_GAMMA18-3, partial [hydrothermal vent metagenome]